VSKKGEAIFSCGEIGLSTNVTNRGLTLAAQLYAREHPGNDPAEIYRQLKTRRDTVSNIVVVESTRRPAAWFRNRY